LNEENVNDQQVQFHSAVLILVLVLVQSTWTVLLAVAVRVTSLTVHTAPLSLALTATHKMLE